MSDSERIQYLVLHLYFDKGMSVADVAEQLGVSEWLVERFVTAP